MEFIDSGAVRMAEKFSALAWALWGVISAGLAFVHPWAAMGAAFGCCFFLASPVSTRGWKRVKLGTFSWGLGYAAGVFWYGVGPPWQSEAMLVAGVVASLIAIVFTALYHVVEDDGPLPRWLVAILDRLPLFKSKGGDDGL